MNRPAKIAFAAALILGAPAMAAPMILHPMTKLQIVPVPRDADAAATNIRSRLTPRGAAWVHGEAARLHAGRTGLQNLQADARQAGRGMFADRIPPDTAIDALAFLVLMEAAQSADDDVRDIMSGIKAANQGKQRLRDQMRIKNQTLQQSADNLRNERDSLGELTEEQSLRLQSAMDRRSKYLEMLSNLLKKISETDSSIIQNMK